MSTTLKDHMAIFGVNTEKAILESSFTPDEDQRYSNLDLNQIEDSNWSVHAFIGFNSILLRDTFVIQFKTRITGQSANFLYSDLYDTAKVPAIISALRILAPLDGSSYLALLLDTDQIITDYGNWVKKDSINIDEDSKFSLVKNTALYIPYELGGLCAMDYAKILPNMIETRKHMFVDSIQGFIDLHSSPHFLGFISDEPVEEIGLERFISVKSLLSLLGISSTMMVSLIALALVELGHIVDGIDPDDDEVTTWNVVDMESFLNRDHDFSLVLPESGICVSFVKLT
jgi:hypothetical protein